MINRYKLLYIQQISNKDLLYRKVKYIGYVVMTYNEIQTRKKKKTESLCYAPETDTVNQLFFN